jgi:hypothetical protein
MLKIFSIYLNAVEVILDFNSIQPIDSLLSLINLIKTVWKGRKYLKLHYNLDLPT